MVKFLKPQRRVTWCLFFVLFAGLEAVAHPRWILPSEFSVSGDEGQWLSFDLTASHTVFEVDKGISARDVRIDSPDGDNNYLRHFFTGHRRSVFDLELTMDGTYKVYEQRPIFYYTGYKSGKRETVKYVAGNKVEAKTRLPARARDVQTELIDIATAVYVTRNAPTDAVLQSSGQGLELIPVTHPNDIVLGEETTIKMLLNGEPAVDVDIELTPGGTRYRNDRNSIKLKTDQTGLVIFTPNLPGPWLMAATLYSPEKTAMADVRWSARYLAFEVIPQ